MYNEDSLPVDTFRVYRFHLCVGVRFVRKHLPLLDKAAAPAKTTFKAILLVFYLHLIMYNRFSMSVLSQRQVVYICLSLFS